MLLLTSRPIPLQSDEFHGFRMVLTTHQAVMRQRVDLANTVSEALAAQSPTATIAKLVTDRWPCTNAHHGLVGELLTQAHESERAPA